MVLVISALRIQDWIGFVAGKVIALAARIGRVVIGWGPTDDSLANDGHCSKQEVVHII